MVLRQGMALVVVGLALGVVASLVVTQVLSGLLYGAAPTDGRMLAAVAALLAAVALVASRLPTRSAASVDPAATLREG
jgi:putative ABC transport system permease protein